MKSLSCVQPSGTPWTAAFQAPPSMGFSRQEYSSGVPLPSRFSTLDKYKIHPCFLQVSFTFYLSLGHGCACLLSRFRSYLTLWDPMDGSPPGSSVHGILQARILEWVAMSSSRGWSGSGVECRVSYISSIGSGLFTSSATWLMDSFGENTIISLLYSGKLGSFLKTSGSTCFLKEKTKLHRSPQWVP